MKFSQFSCERKMSALTATDEMSVGLRRLAEPVRAGESIKLLIARAARRSGLSYSRAYECWYGQAKVRADELDHVRALLNARDREAVDDEYDFLRRRLAALEAQVAGATQKSAAQEGAPML